MSFLQSPVRLAATLGFVALALHPGSAGAQSLRGSSASLDVQNRMAREHDFSFLRTSSQVEKFAGSGFLVPVSGGGDFELHQVSFPFARPEARLFVERLAAQYRSACGEKLVVTSLTRPTTLQPRNASDRSVHPTGMAVDLRRPRNADCRRWLEEVLLELEAEGVVEATRETRPAHYHIAVFPRPYAQYVERQSSGVRLAVATARATPAVTQASASRTSAPSSVRYRVRSGDSLWSIARRHGITVERLQQENDLRGNRIFAGQVLELPTR